LGETIFGAREVAGGEWGGLFWATSLGKIIGGVTALISFRLQRDGCSSLPCRVVLSFRSEARDASGSETSRVHHAARRLGGMAASAIAGQAAAIMIGAAARLAMSDLVLRKFFMVRKHCQLARARAADPPA
jgi:hypothetical protein